MHKNAFALSIVLWIVAALLFGVATLAVLSKDVLSLTKGVDNKLKSQLIAQDVLESLKFYILTADYDNISFKNTNLTNFHYKLPQRLIADNRTYKIGKNIELKLQDASGLINTMYSSPALIASLATTSSQRQEKYVIIDSLKDWRDSDNEVSLNGAEASRYKQKEGVKFKIRNSLAMQSVDEYRLVRGLDSIDEKKWRELKKRFYEGRGSTENLALIDTASLAHILKMSISQTEPLIYARKKDLNKFMTLVSNHKNYEDEDMGFYLSKTLIIEVKVKHKNAQSILKTTIDFKRFRDKLYTTITKH